MKLLPFLRSKVMVQCGQDNIMSDQGTIININAALILELTAGIDKHILSKCDVLSEISIERWEESEGRIYWLSRQFRE